MQVKTRHYGPWPPIFRRRSIDWYDPILTAQTLSVGIEVYTALVPETETIHITVMKSVNPNRTRLFLTHGMREQSAGITGGRGCPTRI